MSNPLHQIHPDIIEAMRAVAEKRERRSSLTINTGGVPHPSTEQILESVTTGKGVWRLADWTPEEKIAMAKEAEEKRTGLVNTEDYELVGPEDPTWNL